MAAEAATTGSKIKISPNLIVNFILASIFLMLLVWAYNKWMATPVKPAGALTETEYNALSVDGKATYHKDSSGYYVKNA